MQTQSINNGHLTVVLNQNEWPVLVWAPAAKDYVSWIPERHLERVEMVTEHCEKNGWRCIAMIFDAESGPDSASGFVKIERDMAPYGKPRSRYATLWFDTAPNRNTEARPVSFHFGHYDLDGYQAYRSLEGRAGVEI